MGVKDGGARRHGGGHGGGGLGGLGVGVLDEGADDLIPSCTPQNKERVRAKEDNDDLVALSATAPAPQNKERVRAEEGNDGLVSLSATEGRTLGSTGLLIPAA